MDSYNQYRITYKLSVRKVSAFLWGWLKKTTELVPEQERTVIICIDHSDIIQYGDERIAIIQNITTPVLKPYKVAVNEYIDLALKIVTCELITVHHVWNPSEPL